MAATGTSRGSWSHDRVLRDLARLVARAPGREELFDEAAARLRRAVAFDGACWQTLDPGSALITAHHLQDIPDRFPLLAHYEYAVEDVNKFEDLARSPRPAATLAAATGGRPERSARFREFLRAGGVAAELRAAFVADGVPWGGVILVRRGDAADFAAADVALLAATSELLAGAVRRGLVAEACGARDARPDAPGVVEVDGSGVVTRASSSAARLLAELSGADAEAGSRAPALHAVASATREALAAARTELPSALVRAPDGGWLVLHGATLGGTRPGEVAVFLQRAHPTLVAPLLLRAYGLTPREQEVTQLLLRGATTVQAAQRLGISPHTVTDHLKAIFDKTGARTRGELAATVFFGEHLPRITRAVPVGDDASFVDAPRERPRGATAPE